MKTIEERVHEALVAADSTGTPQEVLGDDGKRVMLIVCPKDRRPLPDDDAEARADRYRDALVEAERALDVAIPTLQRAHAGARSIVVRANQSDIVGRAEHTLTRVRAALAETEKEKP